jgi:gluconokinase
MPGKRIVVMGVSGCGKSTVGRALAQALALPYVEGDELHPSANVERMAAGIPLTDADRAGWLQAVAHRLSDTVARQRGVVVTCSALKRRYRDQLRAAAADVQFVHLHGHAALLADRMAQRRGHYMPASLLKSQLETLEPPQADEHALVVDIDQAPEALVAEVVRKLRFTSHTSQSHD